MKHKLGSTKLGIISVERDLRVLVDNKPTMSVLNSVMLQKKNPVGFWVASSAEIEKSLFYLTSAYQATLGKLYLVLTPSMQRRCRQAAESPENGHKNDQRTGQPSM